MGKLKIVLASILLSVLSLATLTYAGTIDKWEQCTTDGINKSGYVCCAEQWLPGTTCPSPSLSVILIASPAIGSPPLNNVDFTADVLGTATGQIRYRFDCTNDGMYERDEAVNEDPYTVQDICNYAQAGEYTAAVKVDREGYTASDTDIIYVTSTTGILQGTVKSFLDNSAVSGAIVTIGTQTEPVVKQSFTNNQGAYVITDIRPETYTVTASATGYQSSQLASVTITAGQTTTKDFVLTPTCATPTPFCDTITTNSMALSWNNVPSATQYIVTKCDANGQNCDSGSATTSTLKTYTGLSPDTRYTFKVKVSSSDGKCIAPSSETSRACTTAPEPCVYSLSMKNLPKTNTYQGKEYQWDIVIHDSSSQTCGASIGYTVPSVTIDPKCHPNAGIYDYQSRITPSSKKSAPLTLSSNKNSDLNAFTVYLKTKGSDSCSLSFSFMDPTGKVVDPSFTVVPPNAPNQAPYVSIFDFSGDTSSFKANWEVLYPDNNPERDMKVKCGLNCDPEVQDCSAVAGKGCLPYDVSQGSAEIKKGSCGVPSPAYDYSTTNQIICLFYDPTNTALKTRTNHDFTPVDFGARTSGSITSTVGQTVELKIDITNKGLLPDSYEVAITPPNTVDISPTVITTSEIENGKVVSVFASVTPLVDTSDEITITVKSLTSLKAQTLKVKVEPGFFALPEFGLAGFLQIIIIAAAAYLLLFNKFIRSSKRRKRR